jgi:hypothetical protein
VNPQAMPEKAPEAVISQGTAAATHQPDGTFTLSVHVTGRDGRPVRGLAARDLTLTDNGAQVDLTGFSASEAPDVVALVLDWISLDERQFAEAKKGIEEYLSANDGRLKHPAVVYWIGEDGLRTTGAPSTDGKQLLAQLATPEKMRKLFDWFEWARYKAANANLAIGTYVKQYAANMLSFDSMGRMVLEERQRPGRKVLIWLGRGWRIKPGEKAERNFAEFVELQTRMLDARLELEGLSIWQDPLIKEGLEPFFYKDHLEPVRAGKDLSIEHLTLPVTEARSGGLIGDWTGSISSQIERMVEENAEVYTMSFRPARTAAMDDYRTLKVEPRNPAWTARTVSGYYDEPSYQDRAQDGQTRVNVEQLGALLAAGGEPDKERRLMSLELTERPSPALAEAWRAMLPGSKSRAALAVMVAKAEFLPPPAREIPADAAPDVATQRAMMARMLDYLGRTIPHLPDLLANETILHYKGRELKDDESWKQAADGWLRLAETTRAGVVYRNGREELDTEAAKKKKVSKAVTELATQGAFGGILGAVVLDAARSNLTWSRWEQGGRLAVFRFAVTPERSHYTVSFCCLTDMDRGALLERVTGYHGEMTLQPETGEILRLAVEADLGRELPLRQADILVEYAPVDIGGVRMICPARSVAVTRKRTRMTVHEWNGSLEAFGPFTTLVNDVSYTDYHRFGSQSRILPGFEVVPEN